MFKELINKILSAFNKKSPEVRTEPQLEEKQLEVTAVNDQITDSVTVKKTKTKKTVKTDGSKTTKRKPK